MLGNTWGGGVLHNTYMYSQEVRTLNNTEQYMVWKWFTSLQSIQPTEVTARFICGSVFRSCQKYKNTGNNIEHVDVHYGF